MTPLAQLRRQAEDAMRDDAEPAAALARERLLQMYRERHATSHRLAIESPAGSGVRWDAADLEVFAWLCRLASAGHCGAARLIDRCLILATGVGVDRWPDQVRELGLKYPRIARYVAVQISQRERFDLDELRTWLERVGGVHARIAAAMRNVFEAGAQHGKEFQMVSDCVARAERALRENMPFTGDFLAGSLMAEVGASRLLRSPAAQRPAAMALLERAAALGSLRALDELWLQRHSGAPDKALFLREWLAAHPSPAAGAVGSVQGRMIGAALERGETGAPPDAEAALPWYAAALGFALPAPDACYRVAQAYVNEWREKEHARSWLERGIARGEAACLEEWLQACYRQELGIARDAAAALQRARLAIAQGATPGTPGLLGAGRLFSRLPREEWRELVELVGYTAEVAAHEARQRAARNLELALAYLPDSPDEARSLLEKVLGEGDAMQRERARQLLDGRDWPPMPAQDAELAWKLFSKLEAALAAGDETFFHRPALCRRYLSALCREPGARADPRFARLQAVLAKVEAAEKRDF